MILGLDLGTKTGWCVIDSNFERKSGVWNFTPKKNDHPGKRYADFRARLAFLESSPVVVYFEEVRRHAGVQAAHVYGGLLAILLAWCFERRIPCVGLHVQHIKKHATGKGNADKDAMRASASRASGRIISDDNEADAWWIADLGVQNLEFIA